MKKLLTLCMISISFLGYGQTNLKTITEDYSGGKITYQYYENSATGDFVKHGNFSYVKTLEGYKETTTGIFKDGMRNGAWTTNINGVDYENSLGAYTTRTMSATLTYKDGLPNGVWKLSDFAKQRQKYLDGITWKWTDYETITNTSASMTFDNGTAVGNVTYKTIADGGSFTLNKDGYLTGTYNLTKFSGIETITCRDGILVKDVVRNSSGEATTNFSIDQKLENIAKDYMSGKIEADSVSRLGANISTRDISAMFDTYDVIFQHDYLYLSGIKGDKTLRDNSSSTTRNYGRYVVIEPLGVVNYYKHPLWRHGSTGLNGYNNEEQYNDAKYLIANCSQNIYPEDIVKLKEYVQNCEEWKIKNAERVAARSISDEYSEIRNNLNKNLEFTKNSAEAKLSEKLKVGFKEIAPTTDIGKVVLDNWSSKASVYYRDSLRSYTNKYNVLISRLPYGAKERAEIDKIKEILAQQVSEFNNIKAQIDITIDDVKNLITLVDNTQKYQAEIIYPYYTSLMTRITSSNNVFFNLPYNKENHQIMIDLTKRLESIKKDDYKKLIKRLKQCADANAEIKTFCSPLEKISVWDAVKNEMN